MGKTKIKTIDYFLRPEDSGQANKKEKPSKKKVQKETLDDGNLKLDLEAGSSKLEDKQSLRSDDLQISNIKPQNPASSLQHPTSKPSKPGKAKPRSKKYQEAIKDLDRSKTYPLTEAVEMVKKLNYAKFNATLEAHINTAALGLRGLVSLPYASGKKLRILAFGKGADQSGATFFGSDEIIEEINKGKVNFDLVVTTPEWMPKLAKVARILGPRGLMPNPKNGTITSTEDGLKKAVEGFQSGKTEYEQSSKQVYKTESKAPVIHLGLGKLDQPTEELSANIKTLLQTIGKTKVKKVSLSPTMGPSVKVDLSSL